MAVCVATDCYPFLVWTISKWNFSDYASRAHDPHDEQ